MSWILCVEYNGMVWRVVLYLQPVLNPKSYDGGLTDWSSVLTSGPDEGIKCCLFSIVNFVCFRSVLI